MTERTLLIEPHDPVIFRDGRPFTDGLPATTLPFPLPASTAGAIRSRSSEHLDFEDPDVLKRLLNIRQVGPFAACWNGEKWELAFPVPADAVPYGNHESVEYEPLHLDRPRPAGGCDLPAGLQPLFAPRPEKVYAEAPRFWRDNFMREWLCGAKAVTVKADPSAIGFDRLPVQRRVHVGINEETQLAQDGMLFTTDGLEFYWPGREGRLTGHRGAIVSRLISDDSLSWPGVAPLGGERRLALWKELSAAEIEWPTVVQPRGNVIRLVLATPGIFDEGWKPKWLETGHPPDTTGLTLELLAAAVPRFQPVSGWDLRLRGPKATRFMAPAGSVYFCRCTGDPTQLWMRSICDREQDRLDGYGIVLTGDC